MDWISLEDALKGVRELAGSAIEAYESRPGKEARSAMYSDLPAGVYHLEWKAVSTDTHRLKGGFDFTVR